MIPALLLIAAQPTAAAAAIGTFVGACVPGVADPAAFANAATQLGYVEVERRGRGALFRAGAAELLHMPSESCTLRVSLATTEEAVTVINRVSTALELPAPGAIAMHPPGWTTYRWPNQNGARPRFYLAAETRIDHEGAVSLDLAIHRGPAQ